MSIDTNSKKTYTYKEVYDSTLNYFDNDILATDVWIKKYCLKDGEILYELNPNDMHHRIAKELARIESNYPNPISEEEIFQSLKNFKRIVPQGSPMAGIGNDFQVISLGNCFVIGNNADSYGGIMRIDEEQAQLMKRRGGVGHDLSKIRPESIPVKNTAMSSTGVVPFMERYSNSTKETAQCLHESTLVLTKNGLKFIKDINNGDYVWTENEWILVVDVLKNKKKTYKIKTKYGNEIIASNDHVFSTINGEKKLKEFNLDDEINMIWGNGNENKKYISLEKPNLDGSGNRLIEHSLPQTLNEDFAYILGYMYGDGSFDKKISKTTGNQIGTGISLACALNRPEIIEKLKSLWSKLFKSDLKTKECDGQWLVLGKSSQQIYKFLLHNEIAKQKAGNLNFPEKILNSPISVQLSFISGYFDADGYASDKKKGYVFNSIDKDFLLKIKYILSSVGVLTKLHVEDRSDKKWQDIYSLCIVGANSKIKLKKVLIESLKLEKATLSANRDCFLSIYKSKDMLVKNYNNYSYTPDNTQYLTTNVLRRLNEDKIDVKISNPVLYQDYIEEISEYENESNVYDLVLIDTHLFWANGFYVHNSGRRGALMLSISINHPDAEAFIDAKLEQDKVTGANISVRIDDEFMKAVIEDTEYLQRYPLDLFKIMSEQEDSTMYLFAIQDLRNYGELNKIYPVEDKYGKKLGYVKKVDAKKLWKKIIHNAWKSAEPGILFWNNILSESIPSCYGNEWIETSTNPCGELPLPPYDSCRLLCLNLYGYVINPFNNENSYFNFDLFKKDIILAMRYMDDIIDLEIEKIDAIINKIESDPEDTDIKNVEKNLWKKIRNMALQGRRTGLGVTGEGDMLAALNFRYGTDEANLFSENIHKIHKLFAYHSSVELAKERGTFPIYDSKRETNNPFIQRIKLEDPELYEDMYKHGRRNIALLTIAPVGTVSILTKTTSGIEPVFLPYYIRRRKINPQEKDSRIDFVDNEGVAWQEYPVFHHNFKLWLNINGYDDNAIKNLTKQLLEELLQKSPYYKATSNDVDWIKKVEMQGIIQKEVDHSISVTVNLPNNVTEEIVGKVYQAGWEHGCKGMTVYRDGSRSGVLISDNEKKDKEKYNSFSENQVPKRPKRLKGEIHRFQNNLEKWIAVVGIKDGKPFELFTGVATNGLSNLPYYVKECEIVKNIIEVDEPDPITGEIVKIKKKRYDMEYVDADGKRQIATGLSHTFNPEFWNYAKLVSGLLRHGMPIIYVYQLIESLNFTQDHINSWKSGVIRVIKKYIKDGEKAKGKCPECGSEHLEFKEGCMTCVNCGNSKCS